MSGGAPGRPAPTPRPKRAPPAPGGRSRGQRAASLVLGTLAVLVLVLGALVAAGFWLLRSDDGLQWLVGRVPGLTVTGLFGRPDGGPMEAARVEWQSGGTRVAVDGLSWRDARWRWRPHPDAWVGLELDTPRARRIEFTSAPGPQPAGPPKPPADLRLPLQLTLRGLEIAALQVNALPLVSDIRVDARLGADAGATHEVTHLSFTTPQAQASLQARIATAAPMVLQAQARLASPPGSARGWQLRADATGPLARPGVDATLQADGGARLDARATVEPFAAWPVANLDASTQDLDLATLAAGLPATRLSGRAEVHTSGLDAPARVLLALDNALPGRWSEARLPVRSLRAELAGRPSERDRIEFRQVDVQLGGARPAGRVTGSGGWQADRLQLALSAESVQPSALDARLAAMTLSGPLTLDLRGLPVPGAAAPGPRRLDAALQTTLTGRLAAAPRGTPNVRVHARADAAMHPDALRVTVHALEAAAGEARASASATLQRDPAANGPWRVEGRGELARFDPAQWWPGAGGTWGRGPHALNATWEADLSLPAAAPAGAGLLRALGGHASIALQPSRLAGVALEGRASLQGGASGTAVSTELRAESNRLRLEGLASRDGRADRWQADVDAPTLATFAPLAALVPAAAAWAPKAGAITGRAVVEGRWPALRTDGELRASGVRAGDAQLQRLDARWSVAGTKLDAPLSLSLDAQGLAHGVQRIETLQATLAGSLAAHRIELTAATPLRPPAWADTVAAAPGGEPPGTTVRLAAQGRLQRNEQGHAWAGTVQQLVAAPRRDGAAPWIAARDLALQVRADAQGRMLEAAAAPGRVELLGATLRWTQARWSDAGPSRIALDAQLDPLRIAPWLARLQPSFGWGGDLALGGRFVVTHGERFDADVVLERAGGDLTVTDEAGTQTLGLTDLRVALAAHGGTWHFTQALAGRNVGVLGGAQSLRVAPDAAWPTPDTPLEGVVELRVANLGVWAPWLPPGWRLGGQLRTSASLGGRFGAPEYTGEIVGSALSVRHLLEGVDVRDGDLAVTLRGPDAKVERFTLRGGDGELRLAGGASFGATPRAQLRLQAQRFRVLGRVDRRIVVSGNADLTLQAERVTLDGRVAVDEGLIDVTRADAPSLDADVVVVRRDGSGAPRPAPAAAERGSGRSPLLRNANVSLVVELGDKLRLRGRGLDTTLAGDLFITAPDGRLAVDGTVRAEEGTFAAYGEKLTIERGSLTFTGDVANPRLDILAVRADLDVRVGVAVTGGVVNPRVRLYSEPEMAELDKLSWLVMGRAPEGLGRADTALLQRAALALLTGPGSGGGVKDTLLKNIGLDELSVRQNDDGSVRDTIVTLGKQISQRWYVGYERGVNETTGTWQLIYRVARRFTLRAEAGADNALDVIWTWRWD